MMKVYVVWWCNGSVYPEGYDNDVRGVFSTKKKARDYIESQGFAYSADDGHFYLPMNIFGETERMWFCECELDKPTEIQGG